MAAGVNEQEGVGQIKMEGGCLILVLPRAAQYHNTPLAITVWGRNLPS